jgi:hypothetical protein
MMHENEGDVMNGNPGDFADWRDRIESRVSILEVTVEPLAREQTQEHHIQQLRRLDAGQIDLLTALVSLQGAGARVESGQIAFQGGQARLEETTAKLEAGQARLEAGLAETSAAVQRIIGLLDRDARPGE